MNWKERIYKTYLGYRLVRISEDRKYIQYRTGKGRDFRTTEGKTYIDKEYAIQNLIISRFKKESEEDLEELNKIKKTNNGQISNYHKKTNRGDYFNF